MLIFKCNTKITKCLVSTLHMSKSRWVVMSREAKKQHACKFSGLCDHYSELFTQMAGLIFKMLYLSHYYSYRLIYYGPSTSYRVKPTNEGLIKSVQPFLKTSQSTSFGTRFHGYGQYSTYTCINTLLTTILIPLCYAESSLRISSWYVSPLFLYGPLNSHFNHKIISIGILNSRFFYIFFTHPYIGLYFTV